MYTVTQSRLKLITEFNAKWVMKSEAVPKTNIRINLPGRSALLREYNFFDVQFVI